MLANINFIFAIVLVMAGLYTIIVSKNLIKKVMGLAIFQAAVLIFYISMAKVAGGIVPILKCMDFHKCPEMYHNPLPHILMLTAIVVGIATLAVALALIVRIKEEFGTIEEDEVLTQLEQSEKE
jgi:multicomponent Na+:H+ antiporter subunit C